MKFKDTLLHPILGILDDIVSKFEEGNVESEELDELLFAIDDHRESFKWGLLNSYRGGSISACLSFLESSQLLTEISVQDRPLVSKLKILLRLGIVLDAAEVLDEEVSSTINDFKVVEDSGPQLPFRVFGVLNTTSDLDSIGFINFSNDSWLSEISSANFSVKLVVYFVKAICDSDLTKLDCPLILVRSDASNIASIQSTLRLQAVVHGKEVHVPIKSSHAPSLVAVQLISPLNAYQQFDETIVILSEYNSRREILNKFLSLYHVIESFMFKLPIIDLGAKNNGEMFSIRDFKRLYSSVEKNEQAAIKEIFDKFWETKVDSRKFSKIVLDNLNSLKTMPDFKLAECNAVLSRLELCNFNALCAVQRATEFSKLLYKIRCAVVHNKETELHISHFNLSPTIALLISEVIIKSLEMLLFKLIADKTSGVWYQGPSFNLYSA